MDTNNNVNDGADMWKSKYHNDSTDEVDDKNNGAEKKKNAMVTETTTRLQR